jgi:hypothetical protein
MHTYEMQSLIENFLPFGYPLVIVMVLFRGRSLPSPFDAMPVYRGCARTVKYLDVGWAVGVASASPCSGREPSTDMALAGWTAISGKGAGCGSLVAESPFFSAEDVIYLSFHGQKPCDARFFRKNRAPHGFFDYDGRCFAQTIA